MIHRFLEFMMEANCSNLMWDGDSMKLLVADHGFLSQLEFCAANSLLNSKWEELESYLYNLPAFEIELRTF